jgi:Na+-driven multidrug efflux pump
MPIAPACPSRCGRELRHLVPDPALARRLIRHAAPMALESVVVQGAYFVLLWLVNGHGAQTAAAYSAAGQLWGYVQMPALAISASISAMAAINIGAGHWRRVERIALEGCLLSGGVTLTATVLVYALGEWPLRLFLPAGSPALAEAMHLNRLALWDSSRCR